MNEQRLIDWETLFRVVGICEECDAFKYTYNVPEVDKCLVKNCRIWSNLPNAPKPDILDEITKSEVGLKRSDPNKKG